MSENINMSEFLQDTAAQTPGAILRRGRESSQLSKTEVAQQLRLTVDTIERIEKDDYEKLPAVTFVRGYIRAYAKLLKLPADDIVREFEKLGHTDQPAEFSTQKIYGDRTIMNDKALWIMGAVVLCLIVMVVIWWQYQGSDDTVKPVTVTNQTKIIPKKTTAVTTTNAQPKAPSANIVTDILQAPQVRMPKVIGNQANTIKAQPMNPSSNPSKSVINSDDLQGQKLEDVQPDLAPPF